MINNMNVSQHLFVINKQLQGLRSLKQPKQKSLGVSQQAIVDAIRFPNRESSITVRELVNSSLPLYRRYKECLGLLRLKRSAIQTAASDGQVVQHRAGEGFSLRISIDPDTAEQAYLVLDVHHNNQEALENQVSIKPCYLHCDLKNTLSLLLFEHGRFTQAGIRYQLLLDVQSEAYKRICHSQSELYLSN